MQGLTTTAANELRFLIVFKSILFMSMREARSLTVVFMAAERQALNNSGKVETALRSIEEHCKRQ
jgi:hypothetical protein